jgi:sarcosine oxidase subunit gamma
MREPHDLTQIDLRLDTGDAGLLPFALPLEPNTVAERAGASALWLGPDEWLLVIESRPAADVIGEVNATLARIRHSAVDVSANRAAIELTGPGRLDLLSAGCGLDLHPRSWAAGQCAQTLLARVPVILWERRDATWILVRPSFAGYLQDWLADQASDLS